MRILFCLSESPTSPSNGFQLAVWHLVEALRNDHSVRLVALGHEPRGRSEHVGDGVTNRLRIVDCPRPGRAQDVIDLARSWLLHEPVRVHRASRLMLPALREEIDAFDPDVVHVSHSPLARVGAALGSRPAVLACLDAWHRNVAAMSDVASGVRNLHYRLQEPRVKRFEATEFARFSHLTTVTPQDADALLDLDPRLDITAIPNGVEVPEASPRPRTGQRILFHGAMSYAPNVAAAGFLAREILPRIRTTVPDAEVDIVGREPTPEVEKLAELPGVHVSGSVDSLEPWMASASVYVCPMVSGTGIKNKLLEAFAHGVPSVATPLALQGIGAQTNRELLVGQGAEELAFLTVTLLTDRARATALAERARALVLREHTWGTVARAYEQVYARAIDAKTPR